MNIEDVCSAVREFEAAATKLNAAINNQGIAAKVEHLYHAEWNQPYETSIQVEGECLLLLGQPTWRFYSGDYPGYHCEVIIGNVKFHAWATQEAWEAIVGTIPYKTPDGE